MASFCDVAEWADMLRLLRELADMLKHIAEPQPESD
jgi:hypothetical protein